MKSVVRLMSAPILSETAATLHVDFLRCGHDVYARE